MVWPLASRKQTCNAPVADHPSGRPAWSRGRGPDILLTGRKWSGVLFSFYVCALGSPDAFHSSLLDPVCVLASVCVQQACLEQDNSSLNPPNQFTQLFCHVYDQYG